MKTKFKALIPYFKMIRRWDIIIILVLTIGSFLPLGLFYLNQATAETDSPTRERQLIAHISADGKEVKQIVLTGHTGTDTYRYEDEDGDFNLLEIKDETIRMIDADCNDLVCVRSFGAISKPGETILCLPHKLIVEVRSTDGINDGGMVSFVGLDALLANK
ncbi:hypothetical protein CYV26_15265 [Carnobacterium maltaromaticum]|uniref:NusG domain II-containing protein n=1 Tax=Carnobacterium maltaromaticum TaxID=2751 RepID=UPI000C769F18|nr:NusG domain II-containing protein [Carnobacterium maltaromaticum]PLS32290.1 hypothetical protein CYV33_15235 [Carnobacterium maltaromaticum]PLS32447.1 hypothetical protein CYV31_15230 [Carnobacterium maltaromaticum]PLS32551.1 hypothetical protein CYV30_15240 [Carnobacterium maltaromaticum]PLS40707.1 hypothetical protein CYV28_15185 [Carnobacterium maltaromaticum]PLS41086.1 hypothetical protein CYV27_15255 [Carnobacterium maltaromaticum]